MNTYEAILNKLNEVADLSVSAVRINIQDFSIDEDFMITLLKEGEQIKLYYASIEQSYSKPLNMIDEDLQEEVLMLLNESSDDDIEVVKTEEVWQKYDNELKLINENPFRIAEVKRPSYDLIMAAVNLNGFIVQYFGRLPDSIQMAAVMQNGLSLEFLEDPSREVCLTALMQNALAISFVDEQDEELCEIARRRGLEQVEAGEITKEKYEFEILNACEY